MAHKRPLVLQGSFFTISIFHAHPWLRALHCRAPSAPTNPSLFIQQTCKSWNQPLSCWQLLALWWEAVSGRHLAVYVF